MRECRDVKIFQGEEREDNRQISFDIVSLST